MVGKNNAKYILIHVSPSVQRQKPWLGANRFLIIQALGVYITWPLTCNRLDRHTSLRSWSRASHHLSSWKGAEDKGEKRKRKLDYYRSAMKCYF